MADSEHDDSLINDMAREESIARELSLLFGEEIVEQARLIDIADLNLHDDMTARIGEGIRKLKGLKKNPEAQQQWLGDQSPGMRLLLCLWIMDMDLLEKIRK